MTGKFIGVNYAVNCEIIEFHFSWCYCTGGKNDWELNVTSANHKCLFIDQNCPSILRSACPENRNIKDFYFDVLGFSVSMKPNYVSLNFW